jgi:hypothetical protein
MDYNRTLEIILTSILGGGGIVGLLNWAKARKSKKRGVSANERVAVSQAATPPIPLGTPDWEALTRYWQKELAQVREEFRKYRANAERQRRLDQAQIDALEAHIWQQKPPPPPDRRPE